ncbi:unnamed protein product, partial [Tetraodon nigroviridis]
TLESRPQRMRDDPETQLLQVCRSTGGARAYVSSLALDILTLTAPSSVTQDRSTARGQTVGIKDVKGSQAFNAALVGVQKCTSQHFDGTPAVKRELYWMQRNLKPTQTEGCAWDQRPGPEQVLDSRHTNTRALEEYYRWLYSRLIKDLCQRHWVQE